MLVKVATAVDGIMSVSSEDTKIYKGLPSRKTCDELCMIQGMGAYFIMLFLMKIWMCDLQLKFHHLSMLNSLRPSDAYMHHKRTIIGAENGLSPGRRQAIIWNNVGMLSTEPLLTVKF